MTPRLVDTNILLRRAQPHHPMNAVARAALEALRDAGEELCVTPQVLMEFWGVATRPPDANGLGLTPGQADRQATALQRLFRLLPETPGVAHFGAIDSADFRQAAPSVAKYK